MRILIRVLISTVAVWVAVTIVSGLRFEDATVQLLVIGLLMGLVNAFIRPIAKLLSIPALLLTLGLFTFIINWAMFALVVWLSGRLDLGLFADSAGAVFLGSVVISVVSFALSLILPD